MTTLVQDPKIERDTSPVNFNEAIAECVKRILHRFGGSSSYLFLYNMRTKKMLKTAEISTKPDELEECIDHMFDNASTILKTAIIDEVRERFGLTQQFVTMKEAFESARETGKIL